MTAQRNRAKNVGGTTIAFIQKRTRNFEIGMRASAVCRNQYKNRQSNPAAVSMLVTPQNGLKTLILTVYPSALR
jgi:hypothetical protein